jgi:hypothetical protein
MTDASHHGAYRAPRQGDHRYWDLSEKLGSAPILFRRIDKREEEKMHKQYEGESRRIEHADDATITFTIALHGPHAWEMVLEDSRRYHSISHGWATDDPHCWEDAIAPVLRQFFVRS